MSKKRNWLARAVVVGSAALMSAGVASADMAADITAAGAAGATNAGLAAAAVITVVTVVVGFGIIISMLKKS